MKTIDPLHLEVLFEAGRSIELIDVRPQFEFDRLHALGARSVPLSDVTRCDSFEARRLSPDEPLYIICRKGVLAEKAAEDLARAGFDNSIIVEGGTDAWASLGLPVVSERSIVATLRLALAVIIAIALAVTIFSGEFLVTVPLLIALGVIVADLIDSKRCNRKLRDAKGG